jgi:membrane-bound metal-dependent hydrolase YbcI (DUF457 family)
MPSPVGHALGGAIVGLVMNPKTPEPPSRHTRYLAYLPYTALAACLPDIDFLWSRHSMETHSVGAAVIAGLIVYAWTRQPRLAAACGVAWVSHVFLDWLGSDDFEPLGVMALWPISNKFYFAYAYVFDTITRRYWLPGFWSHNIRAVLKEVALLAPIAGGLWFWRSRRHLR